MYLLDISIQYRVIFGVSAMVLLFTSFLIAFVSNQRKKLQYHKDMQKMHEEKQQMLTEQNALLEKRVVERTTEINHQKEQLQKALSELKLSQLQLIQKEKMASLGELTAGVAHEIQNPLNFVINFSQLNTEMMHDLREKLNDFTIPDNIRKEIFQSVSVLDENQEKILQYGKRADGIVKSMQQHSRKHSGAAELTDINQLVKEFLNLSFHGFKAKHKGFNCKMDFYLDEHISKVEVVPQDIGSLLMNIFNNAFYSLSEKSSHSSDEFPARLILTTQSNDQFTTITIRDNGVGIAEKHLSKIFNPFFTTKPTGEGTGLGLSLCYDIVKAHEGSISVNSKEGEYAEFVIELKNR